MFINVYGEREMERERERERERARSREGERVSKRERERESEREREKTHHLRVVASSARAGRKELITVSSFLSAAASSSRPA